MLRSRFSLLILLPFVLGGCETLGLSSGPKIMTVEFVAPCPSTAVLGEAVTVTKLKPGTPSGVLAPPANVVLTAEMSKAKLDCNYDQAENTLSVDVSFALRATRGAGGADIDPPLDYFVAIVDIDNNVLVKKHFQSRAALGSRMTGQFEEKVSDLVVPLTEDKRPYDYEILTGFQLTPEELAYNRLPKPVPLRRP